MGNEKVRGLKIKMKKQVYITIKEHKKCQKVVKAYEELYKEEDTIVLDAGKYGFVKLQYYNKTYGFDSFVTFTDSEELFDDLWKDWLNRQLLALSKGTPMAEMEYEEIFQCLPAQIQEKLIKKKIYFEKRAKGRVSRKKGLWKRREDK